MPSPQGWVPVQAPAEEGVLPGDLGLRLSQVLGTGSPGPPPPQGAGAQWHHLSHRPLGPGCEEVLSA